MAGEEVVAQNLHKECLCLLELLLMSSSPLHKQMPEKVETLRLMTHKKKKNKKKKGIGHFRVSPGLCIKTRLSAQPLMWK